MNPAPSSYWRRKADEAARRAKAADESMARIILEILRLQALAREKEQERDHERDGAAAFERKAKTIEAKEEPKP